MKTTHSTSSAPKPADKLREQLSALVDGQLQGDELDHVLQLCAQDPAAQICWHEYHLIGDALRSPELLEKGGDMTFVDQFRSRLAQQSPQPAESLSWMDPSLAQKDAVNDGVFRWKVLAGFASLTAIAALSWSLAGGLVVSDVQPQLAQLGPDSSLAMGAGHAKQVLISSEQGTMVRDIRLEELLLAHQQFSPTSNVQVPSDFVHQANFEARVK